MNKLLTIALGLVLFLALSVTAQAAVTWDVYPVLGHDSYYDGNINLTTDTGLVVVPYSDYPTPGYPPTTGTTQTVFTVGQQVHTGSGVYVDLGVDYNLSMVFTDLTNPSIVYSWSEDFNGSDGKGYWMTWNTPAGGGDGLGVPTLTDADVGNWQYVETYTWAGGSASITTPFTVIPEPTTIIIWSLFCGLGIVFARWRRGRKVA